MKNMLIRIGYPYDACLLPLIGFLISVVFFHIAEDPAMIAFIVVIGLFSLFMFILGYIFFIPEREKELKRIEEKKQSLKEKIICENRKDVLVGEILMKDDTQNINDLEQLTEYRLAEILDRIKK